MAKGQSAFETWLKPLVAVLAAAAAWNLLIGTATGASEVAKRSSEGLDAVVGEQGMQLSGGERQKVALARELYREPEILILDEATASLDSQSEMEINRCIREFGGARTIVVVAHRLTSLRDCDRIYVMSEGQVVESGTWDELLCAEQGKFRGMCLAQGLVEREGRHA